MPDYFDIPIHRRSFDTTRMTDAEFKKNLTVELAQVRVIEASGGDATAARNEIIRAAKMHRIGLAIPDLDLDRFLL